MKRLAGLKRSSRSRGDVALLAAAVSVLIGILMILLLSLPTVTKSLVRTTTKQPEHFTELYFNNPSTLPKTITAKRSATISVHIANHEGHDTLYNARISLVENGQVRLLSTPHVKISDGTGANLPITFTTPKPNTNLELIIELPDQAESIHFRSQS